MAVYIHKRHNWTDFQWNGEEILNLLSEVQHMQGRLIGSTTLSPVASRVFPVPQGLFQWKTPRISYYALDFQ
ncbi:DUF4172 domain-containing protein [Sphingobacterium sp. N143]|uniref:DUF4172 domain-containing protein n=1 Tax=Sphingobacterium sp. N143 TaxID=2746727 RepID=UPI002581C039|nr:DUF4172 domain-containing protein [Sphingobacterium sp. N143]